MQHNSLEKELNSVYNQGMSRSAKGRTAGSVQLSVEISTELEQQLRTWARAAGMGWSEAVRYVLRRHVEHPPPTVTPGFGDEADEPQLALPPASDDDK